MSLPVSGLSLFSVLVLVGTIAKTSEATKYKGVSTAASKPTKGRMIHTAGRLAPCRPAVAGFSRAKAASEFGLVHDFGRSSVLRQPPPPLKHACFGHHNLANFRRHAISQDYATHEYATTSSYRADRGGYATRQNAYTNPLKARTPRILKTRTSRHQTSPNVTMLPNFVTISHQTSSHHVMSRAASHPLFFSNITTAHH